MGGDRWFFDLLSRNRYYDEEFLPLVFVKSPGPVKGFWGFFRVLTVRDEKGGGMARRNQNTFIKRQKEIERVRKAKEKMARRQGKRSREEGPAGVTLSDEPSQDPVGEGGIDA
jgi:hypothetical protein